MLTPVLLLALTQAPAAVDPLALQRVLSLAGAETATAEKALLEQPEVALPALAIALRAQGSSALDRAVVENLHCSMAMAMYGPMALRRPPSPAQQAAQLTLKLLAKDEAARVRFAQSGHPVQLFAAVMSTWDDADALERLSKQMEVSTFDESDWELAQMLSRCSFMGSSREPRRMSVMRALASRVQNGTCTSGDDARRYAKRGKAKTQGWSFDNQDVRVQLTFGQEHVEGNAECLLALFDVVNDPQFLTPLTQNHLREKEALDKLERALPKFEGDARRTAMITLIGGGRQAAQLKTFTDKELLQHQELLRGAVLARDARGERLLMQRLQCPFSDSEVTLLASLKDKAKAMTEAKRLLECPAAGGAAVQVLVGFGDASWASALPALQKDAFSVFKIERTFEEKWSPALEEQLRSVQSDDAEFNTWRDGLIKRLINRR